MGILSVQHKINNIANKENFFTINKKKILLVQ